MLEDYFPFLAQHWFTLITVGIISVATSSVIQKCFRSTVTSRSGQQTSVRVPRKEAADDNEDDDGTNEDQDDAGDEKQVPRVLFRYTRPSQVDSIRRSAEFYERMNQRRSIRAISSDPVPLEVIQNIIKAAGRLRHSMIDNKLT